MKRLVLLLLLMCLSLTGHAANVALLESYSGKLNFIGVQATVRTQSNSGNACAVTTANQTKSVTIPSDATVVAAHLFWAASTTSTATADYSVTLDGATVTAPSGRQHTIVDGGDYYFAAAQEVTSAVQAKGTGTVSFTFGGLTVDASSACDVKAVVGGFSLLIIYSHPTSETTFRVLNIYEGLQVVYPPTSSVTLTLSNFQVPNPRNGATGKVAHITWEGDSDLNTGENLTFNGNYLSDSTNPLGQQFNSKSSIDGDNASYGVDFDVYTIDSQISDGMTSATTVYSSTADFVLLHAEIVSVPNVPISDFEITMARTSTMVLGKTNSFTYTVKNLGATAATGTVTVSHTFPSAVTPSAVGGQDWTCTLNGQVVSCTYTGTVDSGTTLPVITTHFTPMTLDSNTNTVTVSYSGTSSFDNETGNNSASITSTVGSPTYVFTDSICYHGYAFSVSGQCKIKVFPTLKAGQTLSGIYITYLVNGVPTRQHNTQDRNVSMYFGLSCHNPSTPYSSTSTIPVFTATPSAQRVVCRSNGAVTAMTTNSITFLGGYASSSSSYSFTYADVGEVELYMGDSGGGTGSSGRFVVQPVLTLSSVIRNSDSDPVAPEATDASSPAWIKTGDNITVTIKALTTGGAYTPNFGKESPANSEAFAIRTSAEHSDMGKVPGMTGSFGSFTAGTPMAVGTFSFDDVGIVGLTPTTASENYLGGGDAAGTKVKVGRITPSGFKTVATGHIASCKTNMGCGSLSAAYAKQPFKSLVVTAVNASGNTTENYKGGFAHQVNLSAAASNGGALASGTLGTNTVAASAFDKGVATLTDDIDPSTTETTPNFTLPTMFDGATPRNTVTSPTTIHIRAADGTDTTVVSSSLSSPSEGGIRIVNGRLNVPSKTGSQLVRMPLQLQAQYWTGSAWEDSTTDSVTKLVLSTAPTFLNCAAAFGTCNSSTLTLSDTTTTALAAGAATIRLNAPGASKTGGITMSMNTPAWLPSTRGRLVFGLYRPPLDYVREMH